MCHECQLRKDGNFMLTAPLELNPASANDGQVQPSLVFSYQGIPSWSFATTDQNHLELKTQCASAQLIISNAHFNFGSSVLVKSVSQFGFALAVFGHVHLEFPLPALDWAQLGMALLPRSST